MKITYTTSHKEKDNLHHVSVLRASPYIGKLKSITIIVTYTGRNKLTQESKAKRKIKALIRRDK